MTSHTLRDHVLPEQKPGDSPLALLRDNPAPTGPAIGKAMREPVSHVPLASIIIPVYNDEKHVARAIESALNQTMREIEVIVVDDGSTDGTSEVLKRYESRIKIIRQENKGVATARNAGFRASGGQYISFLDSDDIIMPNKTELQVAGLESNAEAGLCYGAWQDVDSRDGRIMRSWRICPGLADRNTGPFPPTFPTHGFLVRRGWLATLGGYDETLGWAEDSDLRFRLWAAGCRFLSHSDLVAKSMVRVGSLSSRIAQHALAHLRVAERHFAAMGEAIPDAVRNEYRAQTMLRAGAGHLREGRLSDAKDALEEACEYDLGLVTKVHSWRRALRFLDPSFPLEHRGVSADWGRAWRTVCTVIDGIRLGHNVRQPEKKKRRIRSAVALAISERALSEGAPCSARLWVLHSIVACRVGLDGDYPWRRAFKILIGRNLAQMATAVLRRARRLRPRMGSSEVEQ